MKTLLPAHCLYTTMEKSLRVAVGVCVLLALVSADVITYEGHSVLRVIPQNEDQLQMIQRLLQDSMLDIWKDPSAVGVAVDFRVGPGEQGVWLERLTSLGLQASVWIHDVQQLIDQSTTSHEPIRNPRDLDTSRYYTLSEIWEFLDEKVEQCGDLCEVISIGSSWEGRDLKVLKIGSPQPDADQSMWIDNGIHAREWISPAVGMYFIERLITDYGDDDVTTAMRDSFDWYIDPVVNPDGYDYTHTTDRMWRKTRSLHEGDTCLGVDGNRNFEHGWGGTGSSGDSCSQTYRGPSPFSEPELKALDDFVGSIADEFQLVYTYHSYGLIVYYPWGYTTEIDIPDEDDYIEKLDIQIAAINAEHGQEYVYSRSGGSMAGNTIDWAKNMDIKYAVLMELRDDGQWGFLLPAQQILPTDEEQWAGLQALAEAMIRDRQ